MKIYPNHDLFEQVLGATTKWARTLQALRTENLLSGVTYSIGDSLTYRHVRTGDLGQQDLTGRRRYQLVVAPTGGDVTIDVAPQATLEPAGPYSDLSDRQTFTGQAESMLVPCGAIAVLAQDEAARIQDLPDVEAIVLHVTVEGATFHNK